MRIVFIILEILEASCMVILFLPGSVSEIVGEGILVSADKRHDAWLKKQLSYDQSPMEIICVVSWLLTWGASFFILYFISLVYAPVGKTLRVEGSDKFEIKNPKVIWKTARRFALNNYRNILFRKRCEHSCQWREHGICWVEECKR